MSAELEHAEDVLADLTDTVIDQLGVVLTISKTEGDSPLAMLRRPVLRQGG